MTISRCLVVFVLLTSWTCFAQEARYETSIGFTNPYVLEPSHGVGDSTLNAGFDLNVYRFFNLHQSLNLGIVGIQSLRYEIGPEFRFLNQNQWSPFCGFGSVLQFRPVFNPGMYFHVGLIGDLSRFLHMYFVKVKIESGLDFLMGQNKDRTEWEIFRVSLVYGF